MKLLSLAIAAALVVPQKQEAVSPAALSEAVKPYAEAKLVYNDCGYVSPATGRIMLAGRVVASALNIRKDASLESRVLGTAKKGAIIYVYSTDGQWAEVVTGKLRGWAAQRFIECKQTFHPNYKGKDRKDIGLACSSFASAVLARVRGQKFHGRLHTECGDKIAAHHELKAGAPIDVPSAVKIGRLDAADGVYFFDLRRGVAGHVGFLVVSGKRVEKQYHFTSTTDGLCAPTEFWKWLKGSKYNKKDGVLTLYPLTRPAAKR